MQRSCGVVPFGGTMENPAPKPTKVTNAEVNSFQSLCFVVTTFREAVAVEEIDRQANEMMERLTTQMAQIEGVTEQFKATNQMEWVRRMNNIHNRAEEIVFSNLIFS